MAAANPQEATAVNSEADDRTQLVVEAAEHLRSGRRSRRTVAHDNPQAAYRASSINCRIYPFSY